MDGIADFRVDPFSRIVPLVDTDTEGTESEPVRGTVPGEVSVAFEDDIMDKPEFLSNEVETWSDVNADDADDE
jgi:hypothetical protein